MSKRKLNKEFHIRDIYFNQINSSKRRGMSLPNYTIDELKSWCLSQQIYHDLHYKWVQSGFIRSLAPSVDRKDDYKPYSLTNIQIMTAGGNLQKSFQETRDGVNTKRSKGVIQKALDGTPIRTFPSCNYAGRAVGAINGAMISAVCNGKRGKAHGFLWEFSA